MLFYLKCIGMGDLGAQFAQLTRVQRVAFGAKVVTLSLIPFTVIMFLCVSALSRIHDFAIGFNNPPNITFLRDQYDFLLVRGVDPVVAGLSLRVFEILVWILVPIILLRIVLSPYLFGLVDWRKRIEAAGGSIKGFLVSYLLMPIAIWVSTDIRFSSSVAALASLLKTSPQIYVFLEAFAFVTASVVFVEESLALFEITLGQVRGSKSPRPFKDSER